MDDNTVNTPINGATNRTSTEPHPNDQPLPNDTLNRTSERTCTQKLTIPTLEKQDFTNANMWWRKFVQYIKMTKDLDLSKMTNNKEILPQYREQLETEIKDIFLWAIGGQNAITEMTKTVRERTKLTTVIQTIHIVQTTFYTGKKRPTQQSRFFRPQTGRRRICGGCMETNTRSRKKLRIRDNNRGRTSGIKIPIRDWKINGRL